jgi:hypothetical protein
MSLCSRNGQDLLTFPPNLHDYSDRWQPSSDGVWRDKEIERISYPSEGNETCFQVEESSFWFGHRNAVIGSLVQNFRPTGLFFDVGGGNGFVARSLQDQGIPTVLVEPGPQGVNNARHRGVACVVQSMWSPTIVHANSASAVGLFDVVEHIEDDLGFLQGVHETLTNNGLIFITVPAQRWLWSYEDVHAGHYRRYHLTQLQQLLQQSGFKVEFSSHFFSPLPLPILMQRTLPGLLGWRNKTNLKKTKSEHRRTGGFSSQMLNSVLRWEQIRIAQLKTVFTGSSCVVVGRKTNTRITTTNASFVN